PGARATASMRPFQELRHRAVGILSPPLTPRTPETTEHPPPSAIGPDHLDQTHAHLDRQLQNAPPTAPTRTQHGPPQLMRALRRQQAAGLLVRGMVRTLGDPPRTSLAQAVAYPKVHRKGPGGLVLLLRACFLHYV